MKHRLALFSLRHQVLLILLCGVLIATVTQAQRIASPLKSAHGRQGSASTGFVAARPQESSAPAVSPGVVWVQCSPDAQALGAFGVERTVDRVLRQRRDDQLDKAEPKRLSAAQRSDIEREIAGLPD